MPELFCPPPEVLAEALEALPSLPHVFHPLVLPLPTFSGDGGQAACEFLGESEGVPGEKSGVNGGKGGKALPSIYLHHCAGRMQSLTLRQVEGGGIDHCLFL